MWGTRDTCERQPVQMLLVWYYFILLSWKIDHISSVLPYLCLTWTTTLFNSSSKHFLILREIEFTQKKRMMRDRLVKQKNAFDLNSTGLH